MARKRTAARRKLETKVQAALREMKERGSRWRSSEQREREVEEAISVLRADYYHDATLLAEDLLERIASGEITSTEGFDEALHQDVDGSQRVIYTFKAKLGLLASDNEDAHEDEMGEPAPSPEVAMFYAFRADVLEQMQAYGVDPFDEETYEED